MKSFAGDSDWRWAISEFRAVLPQSAGVTPAISAGFEAKAEGLPNFDRLAGVYRWMEWLTFGPWLQRCRCAFLDELSDCRRGMVLGDGDGRFTARLLNANAEIVFDAVDLSPAMLNALMRRAGRHSKRVHAQVCDAREFHPARRRFDLIATHFFLDCLTTEEVSALAGTLRRAVQDSAIWLISDFAIPKTRFGRFVARPIVLGLYWAFGLLTGLRVRNLPDHASAMRQAGFALASRRTWLGGLLVSELWRACRPSRS